MSDSKRITLPRDIAQRAATHLSHKPYIEVKDFIDSISTLSTTREELLQILQYVLKDESAWVFAALQQILNEANKSEATPSAKEEPAKETVSKTDSVRVEELPTKDEEQPDNIAK